MMIEGKHYLGGYRARVLVNSAVNCWFKVLQFAVMAILVLKIYLKFEDLFHWSFNMEKILALRSWRVSCLWVFLCVVVFCYVSFCGFCDLVCWVVVFCVVCCLL